MRSRKLLSILFLSSGVTNAALSQDSNKPADRIPTLKRLETEYLKQVHEETASLAKLKQPVSLKTGFQDFRCIIHAHSYLSHDSRGSIEEIAAAARGAGVDAIFLSNHPKTDQDVVTAGQKDAVNGVLFVSGSETNGFLAYPADDKLPPLNVGEQAFVDSVSSKGGLIFIAHPEEHKDWSLSHLTGTEIYNTHADLKDEADLLKALQPHDSKGYLQLLRLLNVMKDYPQEAFGALFDAPTANLARYDELCKDRIHAATAGNDSHQNTGFILRGLDDGKISVEDPLGKQMGILDSVKNPLITTLFGKPEPGKEMMRRLLDPYPVSFHYVSTHVLAREKGIAALEESLKSGRTYVAFDWIADPTGFAFTASSEGKRYTIGDSLSLKPDMTIEVEAPIPATLRLVCSGKEVTRVTGRSLKYSPTTPGVYRIEVSIPLGGEDRPWIYTGGILIKAN